MKRLHFLCATIVAAMVFGGCQTQEKAEAEGKYDELTVAALPDSVRAGFDKTYPGATIKQVGQETYPDGTIHYEIEFVDKDGKEHDVELDSAGKVLPEEH